MITRRKKQQQQKKPVDAIAPTKTSTSTSTSTSGQHKKQQQIRIASGRRVLFLIAHPDDETMFFTPTISHYHRDGWEILVFCISTGNHYGQGDVRSRELKAACHLLGISSSNVTLLDHPDLQDGPNNYWSEETLCSIIQAALTRDGIDELVTFDQGGVSAHPNHVSLAHAVNRLRLLRDEDNEEEKNHRRAFTAWSLETTNIVRKYVGPLDIAFSFFLQLWYWFWQKLWPWGGNTTTTTSGAEHEGLRVYVNKSPYQTYQAMLAHWSQFVWYRRLFILFSRYTYVNTLQRVEKGEGEKGALRKEGGKRDKGRRR